MNLTAARSNEERVRVLVGDVLPAASLPAPGGLIDVGSGNGSPGLVFALLRDDLAVTLLEPRQKRWAFLREATRVAGPARPVVVERCRHDGYRGAPARTVALRALVLPLGSLASLVAIDGEILVLGGSPRPEPPFTEQRGIPGVPGGGWLFRRPTVSRGTQG